MGLWRPLAWTEEALRNLRGAVARRETGAVIGRLIGRNPLEVAQLAAPGLIAALAEPVAAVQAERALGRARAFPATGAGRCPLGR